MNLRAYLTALIIVGALGLAAPAPALAHHQSVGIYIQRGLAIWGRDLGRCQFVTAQWRTMGLGRYAVAPIPGCTFVLNQSPEVLRELHRDGHLLCTIVIHEMGHLAGRHHTNNPRDVMYGGAERPGGRVAQGC